ncbi:MAG: DUF5618 family protein [Fibromonadales bacterium]|nr:DUF5618 family protein [Fibromonadales bacterium]
MTKEEQIQIKRKGYALAMRYLENANDALKNAVRNGKLFNDPKYVSSASGIAYRGALVALDTWLQLKGIGLPKSNERGRKKGVSVDIYRKHLAKLDKKFLQDYNILYDTLHLAGYYDCVLITDTIDTGFAAVKNIIERINPEVQSA